MVFYDMFMICLWCFYDKFTIVHDNCMIHPSLKTLSKLCSLMCYTDYAYSNKVCSHMHVSQNSLHSKTTHLFSCHDIYPCHLEFVLQLCPSCLPTFYLALPTDGLHLLIYCVERNAHVCSIRDQLLHISKAHTAAILVLAEPHQPLQLHLLLNQGSEAIFQLMS